MPKRNRCPAAGGTATGRIVGAASDSGRYRPAWQTNVRDEIAVSQALPEHPAVDQLHHVDGVHGVRAPVVAVAVLVETALHLLPVDFVEYPLAARARTGSESFDPVHMGHAADILADRVVDRLPAAVEVPVGRVLVRHDDVLGMGDILTVYQASVYSRP